MWTYSEKKLKEVEIEGTLAPNAEILIDGKTAKLEDVRVDDRVRVTGFIEKDDGQKALIATKVEVTRPSPAADESGAESAPAPAASEQQ